MRILPVVSLSLALAVPAVAPATIFYVTVAAPPTPFYQNRLIGYTGSASFPDILVQAGDSFAFDLQFDTTIDTSQIEEIASYVQFNYPDLVEQRGLRLIYNLNPYSIGPTDLSFQGYAYQDWGPVIPGNGFDLNTVSYVLKPIPEPATWTLLLCGIGGAGAALRRGRRAVTAVG